MNNRFIVLEQWNQQTRDKLQGLKLIPKMGFFKCYEKSMHGTFLFFLHKFINQFDLPALSRAFERCKIKVIEFF